MRIPNIHYNWQAILVLCWSLGAGPVAASGDIPLTWKSVSVETEERGGAELKAAVGAGGDLERLKLTIRGRSIPIPEECLEGLVSPYLNGINLSHGQTSSGNDYWAIELPFDGTGSVELGSTFNLVFTDTKLVWSYQSIQIDEKTWEDRDVCPRPPGGLSGAE